MGIRKRKEAWAGIKRPVTNQKHSDNTLRKTKGKNGKRKGRKKTK